VTELGDPCRRAAVAPPASRASRSLDLDALYRSHRQQFLRLATAITLDRSIAEEVVQDAFASLQRQHGGIDNPVGYLQRSVV